jgi:cytochrome o ubiquinol oxidase operon protein cyoD
MNQNDTYRRELRSYLTGLGLAVILTAVPFALVTWGGLGTATTLWLIAVFALLQVIVQMRYFLHIDFSRQKREDLHLILFSTLLLALMAGGTIWILANLAMRMQAPR